MSKNVEMKQSGTFTIDGKIENNLLPENVKKIRLENSNDRLFYRVRGEVNNPEAVVVVSDPNKIIMYKDGVSSGVLNPGSYPLYESKDIKTKGFWVFKKNALKESIIIDIVVYNPSLAYEGFWGTANPIPYRDPETSVPVDIKGRGKYDIRIADVEKFHSSLVGSSKDFTTDNLLDRINSYILQVVKNEFAKVLHDLHLGYVDIPLHELDISNAIQPVVSEMLNEQYGLYVPVFSIDQFFIDEEKRNEIEDILRNNRDESKFKKDAKEIAAEIERLEDKEWEKQKYLIGLRREDYEKYLDVVKILGSKAIEKPDKKVEEKKKGASFCPKCGEALEPNIEYCPNCGNKVGDSERECPHCHKKSKTKGKYCPHCGKAF